MPQLIATLLTGSLLTLTSSAATYDLRSDWSDSANPTGVWTLRAGSVVLPHLSSWTFDSFTPPQGGWGDGDTLPFWFKSTSTVLTAHDWTPNDIVVHTADETHGTTDGPANVAWKSPFNGTINIAGNVWEGRDIGDDFSGGYRSNRWSLFVAGNLISTGVVSGGDPYSSSNPFNFSLGSGGVGALANVHVFTGDEVMLRIERLGVQGDYVGVNFQVTQVPEPAACAVFVVGGAILVFRRARPGRMLLGYGSTKNRPDRSMHPPLSQK
jgi:hypothetical protein